MVPKINTADWLLTEGRHGDFGRLLTDRVREEVSGGRTPDYDKYIRLVIWCWNSIFHRKSNTRRGNRKATYWWCENIKQKRKDCLRNRRQMTRTNRMGTNQEREEALMEYRVRRREYTRAIRKAKKNDLEQNAGRLRPR